MKFKGIIWVSGFSIIFFFLPSLALKIFDYLRFLPWRYQMWLVYFFLATIIFGFARRNFRHRKNEKNLESKDNLLFIAKRRLAEGDISLEEFRQIKQEIK